MTTFANKPFGVPTRQVILLPSRVRACVCFGTRGPHTPYYSSNWDVGISPFHRGRTSRILPKRLLSFRTLRTRIFWIFHVFFPHHWTLCHPWHNLPMGQTLWYRMIFIISESFTIRTIPLFSYKKKKVRGTGKCFHLPNFETGIHGQCATPEKTELSNHTVSKHSIDWHKLKIIVQTNLKKKTDVMTIFFLRCK